MNKRRMGRLSVFAVLLAIGFSPAGDHGIAASTPKLDVPYVPTPMNVVERMLEMARVGKNDVVYDLGCGDGRIVITAAKKWGARGVGVDLDPYRIKESKKNAEKAGVTDRVRFLRQNIFELDFSEATVVTLYLFPEINLQLRPKLLSQLKPGTRIVSHAFNMEEWKYDEADWVELKRVYYWVVPANVSGTWEWRTEKQPGDNRNILRLDQKFQEVSGTLEVGKRRMKIIDAVLSGDRLTFSVERVINGRIFPVRYEGRVNGDSMEGTVRSEEGGEERRWRADRDPATAKPLDTPQIIKT